MALTAGERLGAYEILAPIGAGGMGEVYRARDTKLGREVAIKVLPEEFSRDEEKLARLRREAHLLASVNHPNIATLYSLEESEGQQFLVMELVEGETLAERLVSGPMAVEEALTLFQHIAEGLEAAHEKGIIHRDLKPANIKVTLDGKPKILDFGLAKGGFVQDVTNESPTLTRQGTATGVILGTAAYMSPEQARGKTLDKRTDIWAFGCCLYESLTGKNAFLGATVSDTIAAILKNTPDWETLPATTPTIIRSLLRRSLQKDAAHRLHDIADARIEIEEAFEEPVATESSLDAPAPQRRWGLLVGTVLGFLVGGFVVWNVKSTPPSQPSRFDIQLPAAIKEYRTTSIAVSRDGARIAYAATAGGRSQLYVRETDSLESMPLPGTEGARGPCFSPDGEWVAYADGGTLKKVAVRGGQPISVTDFRPNYYGCTWTADETIIFNTYVDGLLLVSSRGDSPVGIIRPGADGDRRTLKYPQILPDGDSILYTEGGFDISSYDDARVAVVSLKSGQVKVLFEGGSHARYTSTGHILYDRAGSLMAVAFDLDDLEITGAPLPVVENVVTAPNYGAAQFEISDNGTLVYVPGGPTEVLRQLVWVDRKGDVEPVPLPPRPYVQPRLSPDGRRAAFRMGGANDHIWVYDFPLGALTRFTYEGTNEDPVWSPGGEWIAFNSARREGRGIYRKPIDAQGPAEHLLESLEPTSWSPDGQHLAHDSDSGIGILSLGEHSMPQPFLQTRFRAGRAMFSPDGRWVAHESDESGRSEVYVRPFPGPGEARQISTDGGEYPRWNPKGGELFYRTGDQSNRWMVVEIELEPTFTAGKPRLLFEKASSFTPAVSQYDVAPDGQRFLIIEPMEEFESRQIHVVLNWFDELERLVPTGN